MTNYWLDSKLKVTNFHWEQNLPPGHSCWPTFSGLLVITLSNGNSFYVSEPKLNWITNTSRKLHKFKTEQVRNTEEEFNIVEKFAFFKFMERGNRSKSYYKQTIKDFGY